MNTKPCVDDGINDRLSSLPEVILADIIRLLPFNTAAATSALSKQWRHLWTHHTCIVITLYNFIPWVNLHTYNPPDDILNIVPSVSHTLSQLTSPNIQVISLSLGHHCLVPERFVWLPSFVFQTESLVKLVLQDANYNCHMPIDIALPNLKHLEMELGNLDDFHWRLLRTLSESCPLLQNLNLHFHWVDDECEIRISSPSVKSLSLVICDRLRLTKDWTFVIDTPNLVHINVCFWFGGSFEFVNNPTTLATAVIDMYGDGYGPLFGLIYGVSWARSLTVVNGYSIFRNMLNYMEIDGILPLFNELNELHFVLDKEADYYDPEDLPTLMLTNVKKIKIEYNEGIDEGMKFMKHILSNSFLLELLSVSVTHSDKSRFKDCQICKAIFMLERSSTCCQIQFRGDFISELSSTSESRDIAWETAV